MPRFVKFFFCFVFKIWKTQELWIDATVHNNYYVLFYVFAFRFQKHKSYGLMTKLVFFYSVCTLGSVDSHC
jgi:hypothetical protein